MPAGSNSGWFYGKSIDFSFKKAPAIAAVISQAKAIKMKTPAKLTRLKISILFYFSWFFFMENGKPILTSAKGYSIIMF